MSTLPPLSRLASAAVAFYGPQGAVTWHAAGRGVSRQTIYREAEAVLRVLDPRLQQEEIARLRQQVGELRTQLEQLQVRLATAVVVGPDKQAEFAATGQARGVSLAALHALLAVILLADTPCRAELGRLSAAAGRQAGALLSVLDCLSRGRARQVAADEIFSGGRPILMMIEQESMCWLGGRLAKHCGGEIWVEEFRSLTGAEQVSMDGGMGLRKGLLLANAERQQADRPLLRDQRDHFHIIHRARRARRGARRLAIQTLQRAEKRRRNTTMRAGRVCHAAVCRGGCWIKRGGKRNRP